MWGHILTRIGVHHTISRVTPLVWLQDEDRLMYASEEELGLSKLVPKYIDPLDFPS
jgi:hypothetical protein